MVYSGKLGRRGKMSINKQQALVEAKQTLLAIKEIISDLNAFVIKHGLLEVETLSDPALLKFIQKDSPYQSTSILQISCECDEQIGNLDNFASNSKKTTNEGT
jgi:hypothetical protein